MCPVGEPDKAGNFIGDNEFLTLYVPKKPLDNKALALAEFHGVNSGLFRVKEGIESGSGTAALGNNLAGGTGADIATIIGSFLSFGSVMMRAVALLWSDQEFYNAFVTQGDPEANKKNNPNARRALQKWLRYDWPFFLDLIIKEDQGITWNSKKWVGVWTPADLTLNVPLVPGTKVENGQVTGAIDE